MANLQGRARWAMWAMWAKFLTFFGDLVRRRPFNNREREPVLIRGWEYRKLRVCYGQASLTRPGNSTIAHAEDPAGPAK